MDLVRYLYATEIYDHYKNLHMAYRFPPYVGFI